MFAGAEIAGIKFHAAVDVLIAHNHIYRCGYKGIWLDWMAQGTRVSCNLLHENGADIDLEVGHGPVLFDNNLFLSSRGLDLESQGTAFVHNLICGDLTVRSDSRRPPLFKPHSVDVANFLEGNPFGDQHYCNNLFLGRANLTIYDDQGGMASEERSLWLCSYSRLASGLNPRQRHPPFLPQRA